jgi:hypothetical protein
MCPCLLAELGGRLRGRRSRGSLLQTREILRKWVNKVLQIYEEFGLGEESSLVRKAGAEDK